MLRGDARGALWCGDEKVRLRRPTGCFSAPAPVLSGQLPPNDHHSVVAARCSPRVEHDTRDLCYHLSLSQSAPPKKSYAIVCRID